MADLTPDELRILRHSLGIHKFGDEPYREYFCADVDGDPVCESLVAKGLMVHGRKDERSQYYITTDAAPAAAAFPRGKLKGYAYAVGDSEFFGGLYAETASKARYLVFLKLGDCLPDLRITDVKIRRGA